MAQKGEKVHNSPDNPLRDNFLIWGENDVWWPPSLGPKLGKFWPRFLLVQNDFSETKYFGFGVSNNKFPHFPGADDN